MPNGPVAPIQHGARCDRCATRDVGAVESTLSDAHGEFALDDVPADSAVSIVIEIGGFRRVVKTDIAPCTQTRLPDDAVRLPRNAAEGELPMIAATTGASDALECLLRNIGIDDAELTSGDDERGHVHLFRGKGGGGLRSPRSSSRWSSCSSIHSRASTTIASDRSLPGELPRDARAS